MAGPPDVPLGSIVGPIRSLRVIEPELWPEEEVLWSDRANRFQHKLRAVGGRLYITDRRLVFARNEFDAGLGGEEWATELSAIHDAKVAGMLKLVYVLLADGSRERFVLRPADKAAARIAAAAATARGEPTT